MPFFHAAGADLNEDVLRQHLKMVAKDLTYDVFAEKIALMGGIVEAFIGGEKIVAFRAMPDQSTETNLKFYPAMINCWMPKPADIYRLHLPGQSRIFA